MINTEADKMRKCATCTALGHKSKVYPFRKTGDFNYLTVDILSFMQQDVFWDEEGTPHSHVMYSCDKGHTWKGECESCAWGTEQVMDLQAHTPVSDSAALRPPAPVRNTSGDLVLTPPAPRKVGK